jgi:hypothetical protein
VFAQLMTNIDSRCKNNAPTSASFDRRQRRSANTPAADVQDGVRNEVRRASTRHACIARAIWTPITCAIGNYL